jgi:L-proline amide hydrolase
MPPAMAGGICDATVSFMNESPRLPRRRFVASVAYLSAALLGSRSRTRAAGSLSELPDPAAEHRVKVRGGNIYVRRNGPMGARTPVMFVHGGPGSNHADFLPALALADERAVILYDQLDAGLSDQPNNPRNWSVERFVSEIDAIRAALDLEELHLVGHSWGTAISAEYAARHPAGLKSLVLGGIYFSTKSWVASSIAQLRTLAPAVQQAIDRHELDGTTDVPEYLEAVREYNKHFSQRHEQPSYVTSYQRRRRLKLASVVYKSMWGPCEIRGKGTLRDYDGEHLLSQIAVPTLVMCGEFDEMSPAAAAPFVKRIAGADYVTLPDAGHMFSLDQPELYVNTIRERLRRVEQRG